MDKVSCLMITFDRFELFKKSFLCYCNQDYPNKELIIVCDGSQEYQQRLTDYVRNSRRDDVRTIFLPSRLSLGTLRNISVDQATGALVCQWDDDDFNHPTRISRQLDEMRRAGVMVSYLSEHLYLLSDRNQLFWCDWARLPAFRGMPGTLLAFKRALPAYSQVLARHEDSALQREISTNGVGIATIRKWGHLFMYTYHGRNVFPVTHHMQLAKALSLERASLRERASVISTALEEYPVAPPISVVDHLGEDVFVWTRKKAPTAHHANVFLHE